MRLWVLVKCVYHSKLVAGNEKVVYTKVEITLNKQEATSSQMITQAEE